jgi:mRNA interferase MazF
MKSQNLGKMPKRGEIWWVRLDPATGSEIKKTRPCVVMTSSVLNQRRRTVVVIPLATSPRAAAPVMVAVKCSGRLAIAMIDQVRAVAKERLVRHIQDLSTEHLRSVGDALREILELD